MKENIALQFSPNSSIQSFISSTIQDVDGLFSFPLVLFDISHRFLLDFAVHLNVDMIWNGKNGWGIGELRHSFDGCANSGVFCQKIATKITPPLPSL
jgi:hypothetical protein